MDIVFILHSPENSANIGAAARAVKTMGHTDLRFVSPLADPKAPQAMALAHGSQDILEHSMQFSSIEAAIFDCDFIVSTTTRHRRFKIDYVPSETLPEVLKSKGNAISKVALIFGGERSGLPDEVIKLSDLVTTIPIAMPYPSLNLAQAVMIFSYLLRTSETKLQTTDFRVDQNLLTEVQHHHLVSGVMELVDLLEMPSSQVFKAHLKKALGKVPYSESSLIHELRKRVVEKLAKHQTQSLPPH